MRKQGFTLVELLVVIAIIALLMGILMPSLARARAITHQLVCGTQLAGIGKAMSMYASDQGGKYPQGGFYNGIWNTTGSITQWDATDKQTAFGNNGATVTSSLYLLIKLESLVPKQFICSGDADAQEFDLTKVPNASTTTVKDYSQAWDFGNNPGICCSYSYHNPYSKYPLNITSSPGSIVCADRNPYLDKNARDYIDLSASFTAGGTLPYLDTNYQYQDPQLRGNSACHARKAQNVLFNDCHVIAEPTPVVGYNNDNIYKSWTTAQSTPQDMQVGGVIPIQGTANPMSKDDACLIGERNDNKVPNQ